MHSSNCSLRGAGDHRHGGLSDEPFATLKRNQVRGVMPAKLASNDFPCESVCPDDREKEEEKKRNKIQEPLISLRTTT